MTQILSIKMNLFLRVVQFIKVNGKVGIDMAMEYKYGLMGRSMKGTGKIIKHTEKESSGTQMGMSLMGSGRMIRLTGMEYTRT